MPKFRNITVSVTDTNGVPLPEYGKRSLRRTSSVSCFIPSETDMQFRINIQPDIPFPREDYPVGRPSSPKKRSKKPLQWDILASVYIDGRATPERRAIVYVDPAHRDFRNDGKVTISHRLVQDVDGDITSRGWVFGEIGIETLLDKLMIEGEAVDEEAICQAEEEDLLKALNGNSLDENEEAKQVGQITVVLERIMVGFRDQEFHFKAIYREEACAATGPGGEASGLSHTAGLAHGFKSYDRTQPMPVIKYTDISGEEHPFAEIKFYYRSRDALRKYQFANSPFGKSTDSDSDSDVDFFCIGLASSEHAPGLPPHAHESTVGCAPCSESYGINSGLASSKHAPGYLRSGREADNTQGTEDDLHENEAGVAGDGDDDGLGEVLAKVSLKRKHDEEEEAPAVKEMAGASVVAGAAATPGVGLAEQECKRAKVGEEDVGASLE